VRESEQEQVRTMFRTFAMIGQPAPPVVAHAWLNTPDSLYVATPHMHPFNDGIVRLIAFGSRNDGRLAMLEQIQRQFPTGVQVLFVTETEGHVGPDLSSPADEVTWLTAFYTRTKRLTFPIALWAGDKVSQEGPLSADSTTWGPAVIRDGHDGTRTHPQEPQEPPVTVAYQRQLPAPSPVPAAYRFAVDRNYCVIVDGQGVIRAMQIFGAPLLTRGAELLRILTALVHP